MKKGYEIKRGYIFNGCQCISVANTNQGYEEMPLYIDDIVFFGEKKLLKNTVGVWLPKGTIRPYNWPVKTK